MGFKWCGKYNVWCDEVEDLLDGEIDCDGDCGYCGYEEEVE